MTEPVHQDLQVMAEDEIARACTMTWRALSKVTPWGDTYEGFSLSGRAVQVERNYVWKDKPGEDVLVEVIVFQNAVLYDQGARVSRIVRKP